MRVYVEFIKNAFKKNLAYRISYFAMFVGTIIGILIQVYLWRALLGHSAQAATDAGIVTLADILDGHLSSALCHMGNISYRLGEEISPNELASKLDDLGVAEDTKATLSRTVDHLALNSVDCNATRFRLGPNLQFDPTTEVFTRSKAANNMLTRDYREPFVVRSPRV